MTDSFPNNSERAKAVPPEVEREIEKVISGNATFKKPSGFKRFRQSFIAGDASSVREHLFWNVMIPRGQDLVSELLNLTFDMMIYGEKRTRVPGVGSVAARSTNSTISYGAISTGAQTAPATPQFDPRARVSLDEIYVPTRAEADAIFIKLFETLEKYRVVTVAELYGMLGRSPSPVDYKWGWRDLSQADIRRRGGLTHLIFPAPEDIG
jgi:hypothetical protein